MATIFISYSRTDSEFALKLARDLKAAGVNTWIDQLDIPSGARWDRSIQRALDDCRCILVVLSPGSMDSENVMDEVGFALEERKQIFPVLYRDCIIPFRLRRFQYLDFRTDYPLGVKQLLDSLAASQAFSTPPAAVSSDAQLPNVTSQSPDEDRLWDIVVDFSYVERSMRKTFFDALGKVTALDPEQAGALLKSGRRERILRGIPYSEARAIEQRLTDAGGSVTLLVSDSAARTEMDMTECDVLLTSIGPNRVHVLKAVSAITGLLIKDVKTLVDAVACGPQRVSRARPDEASSIRKVLEEAGASVEIQPISDVSER